MILVSRSNLLQKNINQDNTKNIRVSFSLKREIFFVTIGSIVGAITMFVPRVISDMTLDTQYYLIWLVFAKTLNTSSYITGFGLHIGVATIIGILTGIALHVGFKFNLSHLSRGILFGIISGTIVFAVFFIPVQHFVLSHNLVQILLEQDPQLSIEQAMSISESNMTKKILDALFTHLIWGTTLGIITTMMTRQFGANFRCHKCDIEFSKIATFHKHVHFVHETVPKDIKKIMILGGGYSGVQILRRLQKYFEDNVQVDISIISQDNFFLHTPMLPEMATGMIEPRHIATPIRTFCKRARFYQARVDLISPDKSTVTITRTYDNKKKDLNYDYLVLAVGNKTSYFGNQNIEKNTFTIKTLGDAIGIRNQLITMLENADQEEDPTIQSKFMTFVVVGGGFSGVETAGEINDFVRESAEKFYRNIDQTKIHIILISAKGTILPEIGDLGKYAFDSLKKNGVEILVNSKIVDVTQEYAKLDNNIMIPTMTVIWAAGNEIDPIIANIQTEHDKSGRIMVDGNLRLANHRNIFAVGDCASINDIKTGKPYPSTAQHALREARLVADNIVAEINDKPESLKSFVYSSKGSMAKIGKRNGVALMFGHSFQGFLAWVIWRQYYLATLPVVEKRIRVAFDWTIDLFFAKDITRFNNIREKSLDVTR